MRCSGLLDNSNEVLSVQHSGQTDGNFEGCLARFMGVGCRRVRAEQGAGGWTGDALEESAWMARARNSWSVARLLRLTAASFP